MRAKSDKRRTASLQTATPDAPGRDVHGPAAPPDSLPKRDDAAISAYEREIDRLDAAVHERI
jgi:hypothetical protein